MSTIRLFGIGGMLGNIGWFKNSQIGIFRAYITDTEKAFLIRLKEGKPVVISVSEPDECAAWLREQEDLSDMR